MSDAENNEPSNANGKRINALELGPRKKAYVVLVLHDTPWSTPLWQFIISCKGDPLVHHGRHFCRTVHAMCNIHALLTQSVIREAERAEAPDEDFTAEYAVLRLLELYGWLFLRRERRENKVFKELLKIVPNLEARIMTGSEEELANIADQVSTIPIVRPHAVVYCVASQRSIRRQGRWHEKPQR